MVEIHPLKPGSKVLHIGPPKSGTSALQQSIHASRTQLAEHGVRVIAKQAHPRREVTAAVFRRQPTYNSADTIVRWERLAKRFRRSTARISFLSSEVFSIADDETRDKVLTTLGDDVHVLITARAPASLLPSSWQQKIRDGKTMAYDSWLDEVARSPVDDVPKVRSYWWRNGVEHLAARWASAVGEENVTVLVLNPHDRGALLHDVETWLDVPHGTVSPPEQVINESMPFPEIEILRAFNIAYYAAGRDLDEWTAAVRRGAMQMIRHAQEPLFEPAPIKLPRWAAESANDHARVAIDFLENSSVNVIGDPTLLVSDLDKFPETVEIPAGLTTASAGMFAELLYTSGFERGQSTTLTVTENPTPADPAGGALRQQVKRIFGR